MLRSHPESIRSVWRASIRFDWFPISIYYDFVLFWRLGKINHIHTLFIFRNWISTSVLLIQLFVQMSLCHCISSILCLLFIYVLVVQPHWPSINCAENNFFCFSFSFSFHFQYRAAVSSVHSTPSKSFILNPSSPNSTLSHSPSPIKQLVSQLQQQHIISHSNHPNHNKFINLSTSPSASALNKNNNNSSSTQQLLPPHAYALQQKQRSFLTFGFGAGGSGPSRRESHVNVNVTPTSHDITSDTPEIRKYKKRFNSEILCAALWGVNLLIGTENGLMLLDRSGQGKVCDAMRRQWTRDK